MNKKQFETELDVRFRDIDCLNHVNNAVIVTYVEQARTEFMLKILDKDSLDDINFILARLECDYRSAVEYGESVTIQIGVKKFGHSSVTLEYVLEESDSGRRIAEAETVVVFYDYEREESVPIPGDFKEKACSYKVT